MKKVVIFFQFIKWATFFIVIKIFNIKRELPSYSVKSVAKNDKKVAGFKIIAQSKIDYFIDFLSENGNQGTSYQYFVKVPFEHDDGFEHMWVYVTSYVGGYFNGKLANEPQTIKSIKYNDFVQVSSEDVEDWILNDNVLNVKVGGFSQKYVRKQTDF
jgi:uncharacterized protein YegJ (DUF2314 family)